MSTCLIPCLLALAVGSAAAADAAVAPLLITIDAGTVLHRTGEAYHGTNLVALWNDVGVTDESTRAFTGLGLRLVRFPGGVPCQWYDWQTPLDTGWSTVTPELAWSFAKAGGARLLLQTNTATASGGTSKVTGKAYRFDNSAAHQAAWVTAARAAGMQVAWWEIGNEPEMDAPKEHKGDLDAVYAWYNRVFTEQVTAIKAADPQARVLGPAATNTWFWWAKDTLGKFMSAHGNRGGDGLVDGVSLHWYPDTTQGGWAKHSGAAQEWAGCMAFVRKTIAAHDDRDLPVYITEWSWGGGDKGVENSRMSNALGTADIIGMFERTGVAGHTHFCLQHVGHGWGVIALGKDERPANDPSPAYFALALAARLRGDVLAAAHGADEKTELSAYAAREDRLLRVLLINKQGAPRAVTLALTSAVAAGEVRVEELRPVGEDVNATEVVLNGVTSPRPAKGSWPAAVSATWGTGWSGTVPAYGLLLLELPLKAEAGVVGPATK
jgi:hypothetical protein